MKKQEILALIIMTYDYKPDLKGFKIDLGAITVSNLIPVVVKVNDYLKRKGYFDKLEGRPTIKLYKLLKYYSVKIDQLKPYQDEYEATGHVTQYDKLGNKHIL